ncbi:MAG: MgtC/SapB family protein [Aliidongia sp.]
MPLSPGWGDLSLRLALAALAGFVIGLNRGEHGHAAGLRTTMLVGLAAAIAMVQVNLLLGMSGKTPDSFVTNDLMRLPLGILSGMGFIGGGAILRRGDAMHGVTTAATLWMMTVIGLSFGGGQIGLGGAGTLLCLAILWGLKYFERLLPAEERAALSVVTTPGQPTVETIVDRLARDGFRSTMTNVAFGEDGRRRLELDIRWNSRSNDPKIPELVNELCRTEGIVGVEWAARSAPPV